MIPGSADPVTWTEFGIIGGFALTLLGTAFGWVMRSVNRLGTKIDTQNTKTDIASLDTARTYATLQMVAQIEERLTHSIDRMTDQMGQSLREITTRFESALLHLLKVSPPPG